MRKLFLIILVVCLWAVNAHAAFSLLRNDDLYQCLSTDTKLTTGILLGSRLFETDTGRTYTFDGSSWVLGGFNEPSVNSNYPISVDGDSVYEKDIDVSNSDSGTFTGDIISLVNNYQNEITDITATNPKTFTVHLNRPITSTQIGIGSLTGDFSNVKIQLKDLSGTVRLTLDDSGNSTKYTSNVYKFTATTFIAAVIEFHTVDAVKISGVFMPKSQSRSISSIDGVVSITNSTAIPLNAGVTFTGTTIDVLNYGMIVVSVKSDQASASDGLSVQFSPDGTNWDHTDTYTIAGGTGKTFSFQTAARYLRVVYTNGGVNQTYFRLQTVLKPVYVKPSSHRIADAISGQDDAELIKSVSTGLAPDGTFKNVLVTNAGNQKISLEERENTLVIDDYLQIARGKISGITKVNKYGLSPNGIQLTTTDIWDRADSVPTQQIWIAPTSARIHNLVSTSNADSDTGGAIAQGQGCRTLRLWGLTGWNTAETSEDVIMDGTDGIDTLSSYVIIHRMKCLTYGTSGPNAGTITAVAAVDSTVTAQINPNNGQTLMAIYGVPSTQTAYMPNYDVSIHKAGTPASPNEVDFDLVVNEHPDVNTTVFINKSNLGLMATGTTAYHKEYKPYKTFPGPTIIKFQAIATTVDSEGVAEFDLILVDN